VVGAVRPYQFDRIYGGWWEPVIRRDARRVLEDSAGRYIQFLRGEAPGAPPPVAPPLPPVPPE
jgi:hypothetical protein